jgi:hypothetical protein
MPMVTCRGADAIGIFFGRRPEGQMNKVIGFCLSDEDDAIITALATQTGRTRSSVIKMLLKQAKVAPAPDIVLAGDTPEGRPDGAA